MKLEQTPVRHIRYGAGTVLNCEGGLITVSFPEAGEKQFVFPDAFEKFLRAEDPEQAAAIAEVIILKKAEEDARHREQEELHKALLASRTPAKPAKPRTRTKKA